MLRSSFIDQRSTTEGAGRSYPSGTLTPSYPCGSYRLLPKVSIESEGILVCSDHRSSSFITEGTGRSYSPHLIESSISYPACKNHVLWHTPNVIRLECIYVRYLTYEPHVFPSTLPYSGVIWYMRLVTSLTHESHALLCTLIEYIYLRYESHALLCTPVYLTYESHALLCTPVYLMHSCVLLYTPLYSCLPHALLCTPVYSSVLLSTSCTPVYSCMPYI